LATTPVYRDKCPRLGADTVVTLRPQNTKKPGIDPGSCREASSPGCPGDACSRRPAHQQTHERRRRVTLRRTSPV
jgi:hypothetical protein